MKATAEELCIAFGHLVMLGVCTRCGRQIAADLGTPSVPGSGA